ncbi:MAG: DNA repair protein RecN [Microthrixaceae bacterium]
MLVELAVRDLGVIASARVAFSAQMTALSGETGAGKTMLVEALRLLCGGKADPGRVRTGAAEAEVEALFAVGDTEWVLKRVVPSTGRSRCYLNGELVPASRLAELSTQLVEIHGQHAAQALLDPRTQRQALDEFGDVDTSGLTEARRELADAQATLEDLGGDDRAIQRQLDLLRFQIGEIEAVDPRPGEDEELASEQQLLSGAVEYTQAAARATELLGAEGAAADLVAKASDVLGDDGPFDPSVARLRSALAELADVTAEIRSTGERIEPDEERLDEVRRRRHSLVELRRKYGETIEEVRAFAAEASAELEELEGRDAQREQLAAVIASSGARLDAEAQKVGAARRSAAPLLSAEVTRLLGDLALGGAVFEVSVADSERTPGAGEAVEFKLAANPDTPPAPIARAASGGELSRVMLALRLVLSGGPPTMVFDEVDAGVGGAAANAVGASLASLAASRQVLVVTHLAQVAAASHSQVAVDKRSKGASTFTEVRSLAEADRVIEISRMLSGSPQSESARAHAEELLAGRGR